MDKEVKKVKKERKKSKIGMMRRRKKARQI